MAAQPLFSPSSSAGHHQSEVSLQEVHGHSREHLSFKRLHSAQDQFGLVCLPCFFGSATGGTGGVESLLGDGIKYGMSDEQVS
jgi:hypothetical protein